MKIGDEVYVHGYVDEIRNDIFIIKNDGGYFGTVPEEVKELIRCKNCVHCSLDTYKSDGFYNLCNLGNNKYQDDDWFMHANAVAVGATMKDAYVFDGRGMVDDPTGLETGFNFDVGPVFKNKSLGVTIKPFVGTSADYVKIVKDKDTLVAAKLGLDADLNIVIDNNNYDYGVKTFAQTNGDLYAALYAGMKSVADGVGGNLDVGVLHNDLGFSYKISLEIKFDF